ncbi:MAG: gamma-butyrobetaine hydroxylase-like domain-containing protein, partial [Pyrinomonadaceae bacterium]
MLEPTQIIEESDQQVSIRWSDDAEMTYSAAQLRRSCPCATCVNEWTGEKILRNESVADDLTFDHISIVG